MSDQHRISDQSWRETLMERDQLIAALRQQLVELGHAHDEILALRQQLAAERQKRCGTCADWLEVPQGSLVVEPHGQCVSTLSVCADALDGCEWSMAWPASHGCPYWRAKDGAT